MTNNHFDLVTLGSGSTAFAALRAQELGKTAVTPRSYPAALSNLASSPSPVVRSETRGMGFGKGEHSQKLNVVRDSGDRGATSRRKKDNQR